MATGGDVVMVKGYACKDPKAVQATDFLFGGLHVPGNTSNLIRSSVKAVTVDQIPGLNTLGIAMARIDFAPMGVNPPHTHPRASEILKVVEGSIEVGFITSFPKNRLITKVLQKDDVFVFPVNLVHFQRNAGNSNAVTIVALNSQNPGAILVADSVFGSKPAIPGDIPANSFRTDIATIHAIQSKF